MEGSASMTLDLLSDVPEPWLSPHLTQNSNKTGQNILNGVFDLVGDEAIIQSLYLPTSVQAPPIGGSRKWKGRRGIQSNPDMA